MHYFCGNNNRLMKRFHRLFMLLAALVVCSSSLFGQQATSVPSEMIGGFPIANFALSAQVPADGSLYGHIWANTGRLGGWLNDQGTLTVTLSKDGNSFSLSDFSNADVQRNFPVVRSHYKDKKLLRSRIGIETFCPIEAQDAQQTALPVIMLQVTVNGMAEEEFSLTLAPQQAGNLAVFSASGEAAAADGRLTVSVSVRKGEQKVLRFAIVHYDASWVSALRFTDARQLADYVLPRYDVLLQSTSAFRDALPKSGDERVDACLPYYLLPALVLTRLNSQGDALTMGYCELNQRDSFWTSWMHLVQFKELEWTMIEESYAAMRPSGKIPTCILPEIERWDDLDINLFLILRTARYYAFHHDAARLRKVWPMACRVMDWVMTRDLEHIGIPQQVSFWCDWKDVHYMENRKYSPFVAMLYLAALDQMTKMADVCGDSERRDYYAAAYSASYERINRSTADGGLWNGRYYAQIWQDGAAKEMLCQDQMVGVMYGVIPAERAESIVSALNEHALTPYGVCNAWPYLAGVEYPEATYHNGAVWPWLSFMDCWARVQMGRKDEAIDIMQRIFRADIVDSGDCVPNEHINSLTGENLGFPVQGWNACLFGLIYFAMQHPEISYKL